jgi:hypothetical protein
MSKLFVLGSCSTIAQAIIRAAHGRGLSVHLGDLFPHYRSVDRFNRLRHELGYDRLSAIRIQNAGDIHEGLAGSSQFVYVTHDYFQVVASKHKLLEMAAKAVQNFPGQRTFVLPVEYDHFGEQNAQQQVADKIKTLTGQIP